MVRERHLIVRNGARNRERCCLHPLQIGQLQLIIEIRRNGAVNRVVVLAGQHANALKAAVGAEQCETCVRRAYIGDQRRNNRKTMSLG